MNDVIGGDGTADTRMGIDQILYYLPHAHPFVFIDRIQSINLNNEITAIKNVTYNEPHFAGHFPGRSIMPGVIIMEAMAQTATVLIARSLTESASAWIDISKREMAYYLASVDSIRFKQPVVPGDQLIINVKIDLMSSSICKCTGTAYVDSAVVAEARLICVLKDDKKK